MNRLGTTVIPADVNPDEYVAIYYTGVHGLTWDFPENQALQAISRKIYEDGGYARRGRFAEHSIIGWRIID